MAARKTPPAKAHTPAPAVTVTAPADGLYACGQRHPAQPTDYPAGWFSRAQLEELRAAGCTVDEVKG